MKRKDYNGKLKTKITLSYSYSYFCSYKKKKLIYNFTFYNLLPLVYSQSSLYRQKNIPPPLSGHSNYSNTTPLDLSLLILRVKSFVIEINPPSFLMCWLMVGSCTFFSMSFGLGTFW